MKRYQVTLAHGRTTTVDFMSDSMLDVQSIYNVLSNASVRTIKEVEYINNSPVSASTNYYRELKMLIGNSEHHINRFVMVRFAKNSKGKDFIIQKAKELLEIGGYRVDTVLNIIRHD